ncbi:MAG: class I SAM-dependent methyltransferase [Bacteroidales bacterium]|nr:class I SAM-dependent methyltransferase [Bacteroidales bacterium]MBN2818349.1 class I SAM-dependent methyltransferase [Bacteroidales bacterium]
MKVPKTEIGKVFNYIRNFKLSRYLLCFMHNGYLLEIGWFESFKRNECIDENGEPIPWAPYPYIDFLKDYLTKEMTVFEYGSGYSTLFLAKRTKKVYCVEHNTGWVDKLKLNEQEKITVITKSLDEEYENAINSIPEKPDVIIVDGRRRVNCLKTAVKKIKENGIIVLDDSDREKYNEGINFLKEEGFKLLNFRGITPLAFINRKTTVFYKTL